MRVEPSELLKIELNKLERNLKCYGPDSKNAIRHSLPVLNSRVFVLEPALHEVLIWARDELYKAEDEQWENEEAIYEKYKNIRDSLVSHVKLKMTDLEGVNSANNIWMKVFLPEKMVVSSKRKIYLDAYSETEDFLWLARKICEYKMPESIFETKKKISPLKTRFLDYLDLDLIELSPVAKQKVIKLLNEMDFNPINPRELELKKIDKLEKLIRN